MLDLDVDLLNIVQSRFDLKGFLLPKNTSCVLAKRAFNFSFSGGERVVRHPIAFLRSKDPVIDADTKTGKSADGSASREGFLLLMVQKIPFATLKDRISFAGAYHRVLTVRSTMRRQSLGRGIVGRLVHCRSMVFRTEGRSYSRFGWRFEQITNLDAWVDGWHIGETLCIAESSP